MHHGVEIIDNCSVTMSTSNKPSAGGSPCQHETDQALEPVVINKEKQHLEPNPLEENHAPEKTLLQKHSCKNAPAKTLLRKRSCKNASANSLLQKLCCQNTLLSTPPPTTPKACLKIDRKMALFRQCIQEAENVHSAPRSPA